MEEPRDRLLRYVQDAHAAEIGITDVLEGFIKEVNNTQARTAFEAHLMTTKDQALRLERRLRALGGEPSGGKSFLNSLMGKVGDLLQGAHDEYDKTTQNLIKAYATEHLEIGMYAALAAYATAYGDQETAQIAEQIMIEEKDAADKIRPLIPTCAAETFTASVKAQAA
jgi:ferritin-like metal-binding protein YciE